VTTTIIGVGVKAGGGGTGVSVGMSVGVGGSGVLVGSAVGREVGDGVGIVEGVAVSWGGSGLAVGEGTTATRVAVDTGVMVVFVGFRTAKRMAAMTVRATTMRVPIAITRRCTGEEVVFPLDEDSGIDTSFYLAAKMSLTDQS
jgi:hypothetical protein